MERENQRIALTKRLLKDSMLQLLKEKELDKITVSELCKTAQINRATFYRHYAIPRDVMVEIQNDMLHRMRQQIPLPKTMNDLKSTVYSLCIFMEQHTELVRLIIRNNTDMEFMHLTENLFMELWKDLQLDNYLKNLSQEDMRLLALYTAGGSYFILRSWLMGGIPKSAEEMADYFYELLNRTKLLAYGHILGIPEK